jgi:hypothetical protein
LWHVDCLSRLRPARKLVSSLDSSFKKIVLFTKMEQINACFYER